MREVTGILAICLLLGVAVTLTGVDRLLPLERVVPPPVPERWAALPGEGRVALRLVPSQAHVSGIAAGLSRAEVALARGGAVALVDGRVFASSTASAREVLTALAWNALPIEVRQESPATLERFVAPQPAPLSWRAQRDLFLVVRAARDLAAAHPAFLMVFAGCASLLSLRALRAERPRRVGRSGEEAVAAPASRRSSQPRVRVVLVPDVATLEQLRIAIGEEHVVAATEQAFAFANGWILAARKGSAFELLGELGWSLRPIEMATRAELAADGHRVATAADEPGADTLGLLDALHVCGPIAHGALPRIGSRAWSGA